MSEPLRVVVDDLSGPEVAARFERCGPFADYTDDPFSRFFRLALADQSGSG